MHFPLRWRILLAVVVVPMTLAAATLWTVNRRISEHVLVQTREDFQRASLIFESTLAARSRALSAAARIIARDPRFFSALGLADTYGNRAARATVLGVARDFKKVADADLFEVLDHRGRLLASVGSASSSEVGRRWLADSVRSGGEAAGLLVEKSVQYQVTLTPVVVHDQPVGALVLGSEIGASLARDLKLRTRSEVTFISNGTVTGTTFESGSVPATMFDSIRAAAMRDTSGRRELNLITAGTQTYLTLARPIPGGASNRQLYAMQRSLEAETAHLSRIQATLILLGIVAMVAALLIGWFVSSRITRPILDVVRAAEEMERGNYDHPLAVRDRDEIGYLAHRFQDMRRHERVYVNSLQEVVRIKSEFLSVASHELRTPISVIKGFSELFGEERLGPLTPKQHEAMKAITESVEGLVRLSEEATRVAQIEGERMILQRDDHDVVSVLEDAVAAAKTGARSRKVEVSLEVEPAIGAIHADGPRLVQAVQELVRNGICFTPDGGAVHVVARRAGPELVIEVSDTGVGIAESRLPHLFDRVFMVRDSQHHHSSSTLEFNSAGLGLGLSIACGIVEAHGGSIEVESQLDQGSRFTVRLPLEDAHRVREAA